MDKKTQFIWLNEFCYFIKTKGFLMSTVVPLELGGNSKNNLIVLLLDFCFIYLHVNN